MKKLTTLMVAALLVLSTNAVPTWQSYVATPLDKTVVQALETHPQMLELLEKFFGGMFAPKTMLSRSKREFLADYEDFYQRISQKRNEAAWENRWATKVYHVDIALEELVKEREGILHDLARRLRKAVTSEIIDNTLKNVAEKPLTTDSSVQAFKELLEAWKKELQ